METKPVLTQPTTTTVVTTGLRSPATELFTSVRNDYSYTGIDPIRAPDNLCQSLQLSSVCLMDKLLPSHQVFVFKSVFLLMLEC